MYNWILRELRKQGPKGRAQAKAIEQHLRATGKAGRRSMGQIHRELSKLDNASAVVARKATADFARIGAKGKQAFGQNAVGQIGKMATAWIGVGNAIRGVTTVPPSEGPVGGASVLIGGSVVRISGYVCERHHHP